MPSSDVRNVKNTQQQQPAKDPPAIKTYDPELTYISSCTALTSSIKVGFGAPGGGSYANLDTKQLTFDPEHCAERPQARFVVASRKALKAVLSTPKRCS